MLLLLSIPSAVHVSVCNTLIWTDYKKSVSRLFSPRRQHGTDGDKCPLEIFQISVHNNLPSSENICLIYLKNGVKVWGYWFTAKQFINLSQ